MRRVVASFAGAVALIPAVASAQSDRCAVPERLPESGERVGSPGPRRIVPVGGYTLALTWNPGFCRQTANRSRFQCDRRNRFGFVLHGLWPDGRGASWPQYCAAPARIPEAAVRRNLCAMPSPALQRYQYAKHGTCSGLGPAAYLDRAAALYAGVRYPDMDMLSRRPGLTAGQFASAFARANPGMTPAMLRVGAGRDRWLDEVMLCLDTRFRPRACSTHQRGLPGHIPLKIWRGS
ncbi:ribonuclease T2 family protein [Sphingomonas sp. LT1P40]|uniref:ribonuclease T2 family protein n=1 Tax=Alteristakelama amylovorans TaxID=3096166 RepID=UPI002FC9DCF1